MVQLDLNLQELERQKQFRRDLWDYKPVDHIPVVIWPSWSFGYTLREQLESDQIQFEVNLKTVEKSLKLIPDDYIPWARVTFGYMTIATMFGMPPCWADDPNQAPGTSGCIIDDLEQVWELNRPDLRSGLMPSNLTRLRYHASNLPPGIYITGIDAGGPLNTLKDLLDTNLLYTGFYDDPTAMHALLEMVTQVQLEAYRAIVQASGGLDRMTGIDFDPVWAPEKYKSFVSDDVCATISPAIFEEFSLPYNNRLFAPWGSGLLHNCGPNPCMSAYLKHQPKLKGLHLSYRYSCSDFTRLREVFSGWGILNIMLDHQPTGEKMTLAFRQIMESLSPDVIGVPVCLIDDNWADDDVTDLYWGMRKIAEEYASNMRWVGPSTP